MNLAKAISPLLIVTVLSANGCSLFKRHRDAENIEESSTDTRAQAKPKASVTSPSEQLQLDHASFDRSKALFDVGKYSEAATGFQHYIGDYPAGHHTEDAYRYWGMSLQRAGRPAEAVPHLKRAVENASTRLAQAEALLTLGECQAAAKLWDECLATTFQIIPDAKLSARLALPPEESNRRRAKVSAPLDYQVKAYILRAQALAALGSNEESDAALARGKRLLLDASGIGINSSTTKQLKADISFREMGLMDTRCGAHLQFEKTTEETVLGALEGYYRCIETAPALLCDAASIPEAKARYGALAQKPLGLKDRLPPPGRTFKEPTMENQFESEIKVLIDAHVARRTNDLRNVDACGLTGVF